MWKMSYMIFETWMSFMVAYFIFIFNLTFSICLLRCRREVGFSSNNSIFQMLWWVIQTYCEDLIFLAISSSLSGLFLFQKENLFLNKKLKSGKQKHSDWLLHLYFTFSPTFDFIIIASVFVHALSAYVHLLVRATDGKKSMPLLNAQFLHTCILSRSLIGSWAPVAVSHSRRKARLHKYGRSKSPMAAPYTNRCIAVKF